MVESFWAIPDIATIRTPLSILREQASALTEQTKGVLVGIVAADKGEGDTLAIRLDVSVPALNDYRYRILTYLQPVELYPGQLHLRTSNPLQEVNPIKDEAAFTVAIKHALSSPQVKNVLTSLLSQATEA